MHRFEDQLNFSNDLSDDPAWDELYRRVWPEVLTIQRIPNGLSQWQQWGIDRELKLPNGRTITVDEKKRRADKNGQPYRDIALEYWSQYYGDDAHPKNRLGWALDPNKRCDYVAYANVPLCCCYLLPTELLRFALQRNLTQWLESYPHCDALNAGYRTCNVGVPWSVLSVALTREMFRKFGKPLVLTAGQPLQADDIKWG